MRIVSIIAVLLTALALAGCGHCPESYRKADGKYPGYCTN